MNAPSRPRAALSLRLTLRFIGLVQLALGLAFLAAPARTAAVFGLAPAPGWTNWLLGMMAARFLGYAAGMELAARNPRAHAPWIGTMVFVQTIDWAVTLLHLGNGDVTLRQVTTAAFLPVVFIVLLLVWRSEWREA